MLEACHTEPAGLQALNAPEAPAVQTAKRLAAWLGQLLRRAQAAQIARFRQLRPKLQSDAFAWDNAVLTHSVEVWLAATRNLDLQLPRNCGWWARLTGAAERADQEFGRKYQDVLSAATAVKHEFEALSRDYGAHTSNTRRTTVELDIESRALDREVDQGAEWLVELSYAIEKADELRALSTRAMTLSGEIKRLREVSTMAREIAVSGQNVLERRAALLEMLKFDLRGFDRIWIYRVSTIATKAANHRFPQPVLEKAREVHSELVSRLERTAAACLALQVEEQWMARRLAMFCHCLEEPAASLAGSSLGARTS